MKLATMNTGHADWGYDLTTWGARCPRVAQVVQAEGIDVLFLQEMFYVKYSEADQALRRYLSTLQLPEQDYDKLSMLSEALPVGYFAEPALIQSQDRGEIQPGLYWGLAVISKSHVTNSRIVHLTYTKFDRWPRILQVASVLHDESDITLYNVHLPAESIQARHRCALEVCREIRSGNMATSICAGDLNDIPKVAPAMQFRTLLAESFEAAKSRSVVVDNAVLSLHSNAYRACTDSRIDYIFAGSGLSIDSASYLYSTQQPYLSDHPSVVAHLQIR